MDTVQLNSDVDKIADLCLETYSTTVKCHNNSVNKQSKRKLTTDNMSKTNLRSSSSGKRLNKSITSYEHCSKKKKVELTSLSNEVKNFYNCQLLNILSKVKNIFVIVFSFFMFYF